MEIHPCTTVPQRVTETSVGCYLNTTRIIQDEDGNKPLHLVCDLHILNGKIIDLLVKYGAQNIDIRDAECRTPFQMAGRCGNAQAVKKLVDHGANVSVVKADMTDARRLKRLKNEGKMKGQLLKFEMVLRKKVTKQNIQQVSLLFKVLKTHRLYIFKNK